MTQHIHNQHRPGKAHTWKQTILLWGYVSLLWSTALFASPEEETRQGMEAFLEGDHVGAMQFYRKAAEQGYAPAQAKLAAILDRSERNEEALLWYQKATEQNYAEAQFGLGMMYLTDNGVEKDIEKGLTLVHAAAKQGESSAMMAMYHFSNNGDHGMQVDLKQAIYWLEKIASSGNQWAIGEIAGAYRNGGMGLTINDEKASFWESKLQVKPGKKGQSEY